VKRRQCCPCRAAQGKDQSLASFNSWLPGYIGLGTFPLASPFGAVTHEAAHEVVGAYLRRGGVYIDTAPTYAFGETERLLGEILATVPRESYTLNTSCGWVRRGDEYVLSGKAEDVRMDLEVSLTNLRLDYIDSYISHFPDPNVPFRETMAEMQRAKEEGLVKHLGVSNVDLDQLREYSDHGEVEVVQNRFSLINRSLADDFLKFCQEHAIAIVAYQVIERGLLTDRDEPATAPREGDLRGRKPEFADGPRQLIKTWVDDRVTPIARRLGVSTEALVMAWTLAAPGVAVVQCGASTVDQLDAFDEARSLQVEAGDAAELEQAYEDLCRRVEAAGHASVREMMGLGGADPLKGLSASGR
jgi:aryl-alcohol dehydrogenase-like predicted oxidoreductase